MRAIFVLFLATLFLNACATVDETPLTLEHDTSVVKSEPMPDDGTFAKSKTATKKSKKKSKALVKAPVVKAPVVKAEVKADVTTSGAIVVDDSDIALANRMAAAMDAFVFKNEQDEFIKLCKDKRFDCLVDEKVFPDGKKKSKRAAPPFMSGAKNGIQRDTRVYVKYDFYP